MCDLEEIKQCSLISSETYSEKKKLAQPMNENEKNEDNSPEMVEKSEACGSASKILLEQLSDGILSLYVKDVKKAAASLNELTRNQNIVIETLEQESTKVTEALSTYRLEDMFSRIKLYHAKAQTLKKDMMAIHERTLKLKKRALRLQQQKQKEALQKELQRDREIERDKQLAPKIATKSSTDK